MYPTLLSVGVFEFHAYTVAMAIAFLVGVLCSVNENYRLENPYPVTPMGGIWIFFAALFGARAYHIVQYGEIARLYEMFYFWSGGLVYYGGFLGGLAGGIAYVLYKRVPILPMGDIGLPYLALAHSIARLGCFLNSCCWGSITSMPWGIHFPANPVPGENTRSLPFAQHLGEGLVTRADLYSLPVHPTQLYSTLGLFTIFILMRLRFKARHHVGEVMLMYPILYGLMRFIVEAFRGDSARSLYGMTVSQGVALTMFLGGGVIWIVLKSTIWRGPGTKPAYARSE